MVCVGAVAAVIKASASVKFWTKGNKCRVDKFKWISISFIDLQRRCRRKGVIRGGRDGDGQVWLLGELDNSIHLASHVISSPRP